MSSDGNRRPRSLVRLLTLQFWRLTSKEEISGLINHLIDLISQSHQAWIWCVGTSDSVLWGPRLPRLLKSKIVQVKIIKVKTDQVGKTEDKWICCLAIIGESWIDFCWGHFIHAPGLFHKVWGLIHSGASCGILLASCRVLADTLRFCTKVRDLVERFGGRDTSWTWGLQDMVGSGCGEVFLSQAGIFL